MIHIVAAGHPTQCQNSQITIQQKEMNLLFPDCLCPEVAVLTNLIFSVRWRGFLQYLPTAFGVSETHAVIQLYTIQVCVAKLLNADYDFMLVLSTLRVWDMRCEAALLNCTICFH